ncbi:MULTISPECIES: bestrophin family protein [Rhodonellum]|nr:MULTISPECIES: bestrophin family ion channel [Rhodonellum]MDO9553510.1 bestrophin family ion channel [Rhodonellum sp.]
MFYYNPKDWILAIFRITKSETIMTLAPTLIFISLYSWGIVYLEVYYLKLSENSYAKDITIMHSLLGFAISMLLVFRTNTAYDRWWEGRKLWGSLVNNSRNLAIKLKVFLPAEDQGSRTFFRQVIPLYASALHKHLQKESTKLQLDEKPHPELPDFDNNPHVPNKVAESMIFKINDLYKNKIISGDQLIVLNDEMRSFTEICGACERIKNTPIPFSYSAFIKKFIFIYAVTLPFGLALSLGYFTIPVTAFIFYVLASLELIAEEIEDPFGTDINDLPMEKIADNIKRNVKDILT